MSADNPHVLDYLSAYADAMVTPTDKQAIGDHLTQCPDCAQRHQELLHLRKVLRETPILTPPIEVYESVRRRSGMAARVIWQRVRLPLQIIFGLCVLGVGGKYLVGILPKFDASTKVPELSKPIPAVTVPTTAAIVTTPTTAVTETPTTTAVTTTTIPEPVKKSSKPVAPKKAVTPPKKLAPKSAPVNTRNLATAVLPGDSAGQGAPLSKRPPIEAHLPSESTKMKPSDLVEWRGVDSKIQKQKTYIIRSTDSMEDLWRKHAPDAPVPVVDFNLYMVVGVTMGQTHVKGKGIEVMGTRNTSEAFIIYLREGADLFRHPTTLSTYTPYHFKVIPKTDLPVQFQKM